MAKDTVIVTMEGEYEIVRTLSNGTILMTSDPHFRVTIIFNVK